MMNRYHNLIGQTCKDVVGA